MSQGRKFTKAIVVAVGLLLGCGRMPEGPVDAARRLADEGRHEEAVAAFEAILASSPGNAIAVSGWCRSMRRLGRVDAITSRFESGASPGARLARGLAAVYAGNADAAEAELAGSLESYQATGDEIAQATALSALGVLDIYFRNEPERAIVRLDRAEALARAARDEISTAEILSNRASAALRAGDRPRAEAAFVEADGLAGRHHFDGLRATLQMGLGNLRQSTGDWKGAIDAFGRARTSFEVRNDPIGRAQAGVNLALALQRTGRHEEAIDTALAAGASANTVNDPRLAARALEAQGNSLVELGLVERARAAFSEALRRLEGVDAPDAVAAIRTGLGNVELAARDLDAACAWYGKSLELNLAAGNEEGEAVDRLNLGNAHMEAGRWAAAAEEFDRAADLYENNVDDPGRQARALVGLARIDEVVGNLDPARKRLERALELTRRAADPANEAFVLSLLGHRDLEDGAPAAALARFEQAELTLSGSDLRPELARQILSSADALRALGRLEEARRRAQQALQTLGEDGDLDLRGLAELSLGSTDSNLGEDRRALDHLGRADLLLDQAHDEPIRVEARVLAARLHERLGDRTAAREALEVATRIEEDLLARAGGADVETGLQARSPSASHALALLLARAGEPTAALETLERGRARALRRQIAAAGLTGAQDENAREWRRARAEISRCMIRLRRATLSKAERSDLQDRIDRAERDAARFVRARERQGGLLDVNSELNASALQSRLAGDEALAVFAIDEPHSYVWLVRDDRIELLTIAGAAELRGDVDRLAERLLAGDAGEVNEAAEQLGRLVAEPLAARWSGIHHLYVVPDDALWRVPFHVLRVGEGEGRYMAEVLATSVLPAAALLPGPILHEHRPAGPWEQVVVAFGDPRLATPRDSSRWQLADLSASTLRGVVESAGRLPPLPASAAEARAIQRLYPPGRSVALVGEEATERAFKEWAGRGVAVLHVASHALWDERVLDRSALVLSTGDRGDEDGLLTLGEIAELNLDGCLVVLSACRTAGHRIVSGEGMQGLARAFLGAGANGVVATQWPIEDRAAAAVMTAFHRGLAAGRPVAQALNDARVALIGDHDPELSAPSAWAAFVLVGDARVTIGKR